MLRLTRKQNIRCTFHNTQPPYSVLSYPNTVHNLTSYFTTILFNPLGTLRPIYIGGRKITL